MTKMDTNGQKNEQQLTKMDRNWQKWTIMKKNGQNRQKWTEMDYRLQMSTSCGSLGTYHFCGCQTLIEMKNFVIRYYN